VLVGRLPHQIAGDREDRDDHQKADQQRKVTMVELVLAKHDDAGDLGPDCDYPCNRGKQSKPGGC
jgi:hypothetical protein